MTDLTGTLWIAGGGALGAYFRFQISAWFAAWFGKRFPYGTLFVNVLGSFIMGAIVGAIKIGAVPGIPWHDFIAEGFLGALTTFSTFSMDTFNLYQAGDLMFSGLNILLNAVICICAVWAGYRLVDTPAEA